MVEALDFAKKTAATQGDLTVLRMKVGRSKYEMTNDSSGSSLRNAATWAAEVDFKTFKP